jgi:ankyrin repeat protein
MKNLFLFFTLTLAVMPTCLSAASPQVILRDGTPLVKMLPAARTRLLGDAIKQGHVNFVKKLARSRLINLDDNDQNNLTPWMIAYLHNNLQLLHFLVYRAAAQAQTQPEKDRALHVAILFTDQQAVKKALFNGANPNAQSTHAPYEKVTQAIIDKCKPDIIEQFANPSAIEIKIQNDRASGLRPLHLCAQISNKKSGRYSGNQKIMQILLNAQANYNLPDNQKVLPRNIAKTPHIKALLSPEK